MTAEVMMYVVRVRVELFLLWVYESDPAICGSTFQSTLFVLGI